MFPILLVFLFARSSSSEVQRTKVFSEKDLKQVQDHYTKYPYPPTNEQVINDTFPMIHIQPHLEELNHYIYGGKGDLGRSRAFRILIAGGGTGSSLLHYANMFANLQVSIVYLDFSSKSLEIAKRRAENFGYQNITFIHDSIYNIPKLNLELFDFIDCYGVLHHLPDRDEGLRILKDSLVPNGGMLIMLYAYMGRQGIYSMQGSAKIISRNRTVSLEEEVSRGRLLLKNHHLRSRMFLAGFFPEARSDAGFYDLYLHKQDKAFTIPELYDYIEDKGGLKIVTFASSHYRKVLHECPHVLKDLDVKKRFAVNEMIIGNEIKQTLFLSKLKIGSEATVENLDNIPYFIVQNFKLFIESTNEKTKEKMMHVFTEAEGIVRPKISIAITKYSNVFFKLIALNEYTIGEIINHIVRKKSSKKKSMENLRQKVSKDLKATLRLLIINGLLLLRHKSVPEFKRIRSFGIIKSVTLI